MGKEQHCVASSDILMQYQTKAQCCDHTNKAIRHKSSLTTISVHLKCRMKLIVTIVSNSNKRLHVKFTIVACLPWCEHVVITVHPPGASLVLPIK
jgi:hypothetical protein